MPRGTQEGRPNRGRAGGGSLDNSWIPAIMGTLGAVLGVLALWLMPDFPAQDYITAAAIGAVSGFAATGINQVLIQSAKRKEQV